MEYLQSFTTSTKGNPLSERNVQIHQLRWAAVNAKKQLVNSDFQEIYDLLMPYVGSITTKETEGSRRTPGIYDTTGVINMDLLVNFVMANMVPSTSRWIMFMPPKRHADKPEVMKPLEEAAEELFAEYGNSNFYVELAAAVQSFFGIGNTLIRQHLSKRHNLPNQLMFDTVPMGNVGWQIGSDRIPNYVYVRHEMSAIDAVQFFTQTKELEVSALPRSLTEMANSPRGMDKVEILQCQFENEKFLTKEQIRTSRKKRWLVDWIYMGPGGMEMLMDTEGYDIPLFTAGRLMVVNGEDYGRGRGHIVRPVLKRLNRIKYLGTLAMSRELLPTLLIEDQSVLQLTGKPGGTAIFRPNSTPPSFLTPGSNHQMADDIANLEREQVRRGLLTEALEEKDTESRSATESLRRDRTILRNMHSPTNILRRQVMDPTVQTSVDLLRDDKRLQQLDEAFEAAGEVFPVTIRYISPFFAAQAQGQLSQVESYVDRMTNRAVALQDPTILDPIDMDEVAYAEAELGEVPARILKGRELVARARELRAAQQDRAEARQNAEVVAKLNQSQPQPAGAQIA